MRIGLYGMPTAGKTTVLERINFLDVLEGSRLLREYDPDFDRQSEMKREQDRKDVARLCMKRDSFIMDGHYAFGDLVAFTEEEGQMYDRYVYLYTDPKILRQRMEQSEKNQKYLKYDLAEWQGKEIDGLRAYCHNNMKDFYVIDNPPENEDIDVDSVISFLGEITNGFSNVKTARRIADEILRASDGPVILIDGDKTLIVEDSSNAGFGYETHLFDGNFYTGYQSWKQDKEFQKYEIQIPNKIPVCRNPKLPFSFEGTAYIVSTGNDRVWISIAKQFKMPCFAGKEISAETKLYLVKFLQQAGRKVIAYGDGKSDLYMLKEADVGFLVSKADGGLSRSLWNEDIGGLTIV